MVGNFHITACLDLNKVFDLESKSYLKREGSIDTRGKTHL